MLTCRMAKKESLKRVKTDDSLHLADADLISNLPRGVIDVILERLPLRDAARMSVLSHKWHDIWRTIQTLAFDVQFFSRPRQYSVWKLDTHEFSCIVSKILFYHSGELPKFHLTIPFLRSRPDVDQWVCYLSKARVSDICIENHVNVPLTLSSLIFSCDNLEKLKLRCLTVAPAQNFVGFKKLTSLELDKITINENTFNCIMSNSPLLKKLTLIDCVGVERIVIDAPNLDHLTVRGVFVELDVRNAETLVSADFGLDKWVDASHTSSLGVLIQGLASSPKLQNLIFRGRFVMAFRKEILQPPAFEKLRRLDLIRIDLNDADEFYSIINAIHSCPAIERLYITVHRSRNLMSTFDYSLDSRLQLLQQLCYVDLDICRGSYMELKLIEYLLACCPILKKIMITSTSYSHDTRRIFRPKMMAELIRFRRASQMVEVICPDSKAAPDWSDEDDPDYY